MHTKSMRALRSVALSSRASKCTATRLFHSSTPARLGSNGNPSRNGSRSSNSDRTADDESTLTQNDDPEPLTGTDTAGGRSRGRTSNSSRNRQTQKRSVSELPPVHLPKSFLDTNVSLWVKGGQPQLPEALVEDAKYPKRSGLYGDVGPISKDIHATVESYFESALESLLLKDCEMALDFEHSKLEEGSTRWNSPVPIEKVVRIWDMILDSAWHLTDALYPARMPEYVYKKRPFWWWHWHKDLDARTLKFRDKFLSLNVSLDEQFSYAEQLDYALPHAIADLPVDTFMGLQRSLLYELRSTAPVNFDAKTSRRPITVLGISGYGGRAISEAVAANIAFWNHSDLIRLDAYDLSHLVGGYLGQSWAYSRGGLSMMGFRAAELNGRLVVEPEIPSRQQENEDGDTDLGAAGFRPAFISMDEDLQKAKQSGALECFSRWDNLKIDKMLDYILRAVELKSGSPASRPILLHIHDFVEMSMTLEGSLIIGRLRALVDAAWQNGIKIAIFGTSSSETPSAEYQNIVQNLAYEDLVVTRHIQPGRVDKLSGPRGKQPRFNLQKTDYFVENLANIKRMLAAMSPETESAGLSIKNLPLRAFLRSVAPRFSILRESVLPVPEVYHLASSILGLSKEYSDSEPAAFVERFTLGPLRQRPGENFLDDEPSEDKQPKDEKAKVGDDVKSDGRAPMKLNEYEKRISSGQINRDNLRTTFADVHVPPETVSALKLLTSLALVRPDAFSYGVLAADKIPGCLLYGPPGTGKTMLAKAVAKESGANMLEVSGATINDKWVGESEKLIRAVFTLAKKLSPCVVFIDEADSLLANRSMFSNRASHREHINQFLKEWDGMEETNAFIMVATNRPFDLDDAVLRRLPRKILVDLPLQNDRAAILRLLLKDEDLDSSVNLEEFSKRTPYYSGSDLKNVCVAAAMAAVEEENLAAAEHSGPEPFQYPKKRTLHRYHFDRALKQIPASISEDMVSLKQIRRFDEEYGNRKKGGKKAMGFRIVDDNKIMAGEEARIRPENP